MGLGTTTTQAYGEASYWDKRYGEDSSGGSFDWYQKYNALAPLLHLYLHRHNRILVVGCGNAGFSEGMAKDDYEDIVNIDISSVVIESMKNKYKDDFPALKCTPADIKMDVRDMGEFDSGSFDAVIDKGTLDSIMCGHNSQENATKMLAEVGRVLKDKGAYILITYGAPAYRLSLLKDMCLWNIKLHVIEKPMAEGSSEHKKWELTSPVSLGEDGSEVDTSLGRNPEVHYIYVCTKEESLSSNNEVEIEG